MTTHCHSLRKFLDRSNVSNVVFPFRTGKNTSADFVPMRHFESARETNVLFVPKNSAKIPAPDLGSELWDKSRLVSRLRELRSFLSRMAGNLRPFDRRANSLRDLFFLRECASSF